MFQQPKPKESLLSQRGHMAFWGVLIWLCMAFFTLSAFWEHIDTLRPANPGAAKFGACGPEIAILAMIVLHCFNKHIGVRKWALIMGAVLSALALIHAGALRGLSEAEIKQSDTEQRVTDALTKMSAEQAGAIKSVDTGTQRERLAKNREAVRQQREIATNAQKEVAETIKSGAERVKSTSILPLWYLNGWMYSVIFIAAVAATAFVFSRMLNREDIDADFDGIPDRLQQGRETPFPLPPVEGFARASREQPDPKAQTDRG